jgi:hypothetical protein
MNVGFEHIGLSNIFGAAIAFRMPAIPVPRSRRMTRCGTFRTSPKCP